MVWLCHSVCAASPGLAAANYYPSSGTPTGVVKHLSGIDREIHTALSGKSKTCAHR